MARRRPGGRRGRTSDFRGVQKIEAHLRRRRKDHDDTPSNEIEGLIGRQPLRPIVPPGTEWRPNSLDEVQWSLYLGVALEWAININLREVLMSDTSQIALIRKLYGARGNVNTF